VPIQCLCTTRSRKLCSIRFDWQYCNNIRFDPLIQYQEFINYIPGIVSICGNYNVHSDRRIQLCEH
jgi:hypothetical protein